MQSTDADHLRLMQQAADRVLVLRRRLLEQRRELQNFADGREKLDQALMALDGMLINLESKP
ncbi:MAG: hypothetical protein IT447_12240 [Phycisphaerales bacterium]|jgi:hypothetical protein|nr:hypothetical protein [Phycisphaerales bacterium]